MADRIELNVDVRERTGKGGAREARRNGFVPGVLYGGGQDPVAINLKKNEVQKAINTGQFLSSTVDLIHEGKKQLVIPQAIQMHPVSDQPQHIDLFRVDENQIIQVEVTVNFVGEENCPGLRKGGNLNIVRYTVELNVKAGSIPESVTADISELEIGDVLNFSAIQGVPEGATPTITDRDFTIATIAGRGGKADTEDDAAAEGGEEAAAEGDAPAEGGDS